MCDLKNLSDEEKEIIHQVMEGKTNKEIGDKICKSHRTVENKLSNIYASCDVKNRLGLIQKILKKK